MSRQSQHVWCHPECLLRKARLWRAEGQQGLAVRPAWKVEKGSKASGRESVNDKREKLSLVSGLMDAGSGSDGERSGSASALISGITKVSRVSYSIRELSASHKGLQELTCIAHGHAG